MSFRNPLAVIMTDTAVIRVADVRYIDISEIKKQRIKLFLIQGGEPLMVSGFAAMELIWHIKPGALEGHRIKWAKHSWAIHNLIAHPAMQLLAFAGCYKLAMWVHDVTVPRPRP